MKNKNRDTEDKAVQYVLNFERRRASCEPQDVRSSNDHRGYDVLSGERLIEVKGGRESWETYNWVPLYKTEVQCLKKNPDKFYLYLVRFKDKISDDVESLYIVPGRDLLDTKRFRIKAENYSLTPISRKSLTLVLSNTR